MGHYSEDAEVIFRKGGNESLFELSARTKVNLQMRDYASHPCMRIDERHVDAEWLLENKECTDREFEHDQ